MNVDHIAMYVSDLKAAKKFFVKYFNAEAGEGYHNRETGFSSCFLTFDGGARLELMNRPDMVECEKHPVRTGYSHIAFSVGSRQAVDGLTERLQADGYKVMSGPRTTGDGYYESCIIAIEGNLVEITE